LNYIAISYNNLKVKILIQGLSHFIALYCYSQKYDIFIVIGAFFKSSQTPHFQKTFFIVDNMLKTFKEPIFNLFQTEK